MLFVVRILLVSDAVADRALYLGWSAASFGVAIHTNGGPLIPSSSQGRELSDFQLWDLDMLTFLPFHGDGVRSLRRLPMKIALVAVRGLLCALLAAFAQPWRHTVGSVTGLRREKARL